MIPKKFMLFSTIALLIFIISKAHAIPIDLNTFNPVPPASVSISADGFAATLYEDELTGMAPVALENWSLFIPVDASSLSFEYDLVVANDNEDYFDFHIGSSLSVPTFEIGGVPGRYSGSYNYGLTGLQGSTVPVIFNIMYGWSDWSYESTLTIKNVNINPVPEPSTLMLILPALLSCGIYARKKLFKKNYPDKKAFAYYY